VWNNDQSGPRNVQKGELIAFEPATGDILWRRQLGTGAVNTPCLGTVGGEPALFVPYEPGAIFAISARDGRDLWPRPYAGAEELHGGLSVATVDGRQLLFFGGRTAWAYAVDAETGEQAWDLNVGTWVDSTPAFAVIDGKPTVFFGTYTYFIVACDAATGAVLWRYRTRGIIQGSPALTRMGDEPVVCVNSLDDHVYVVSARDGRFLFRHHLGRFPWTHYLKGKTIWSSCVVGTLDGEPTLVAPSYSGVVHAFAVTGEDANAGPPRETFWDALGASYTIPVLVVVGIVLVLTLRRLVRGAPRPAPQGG
jgi:outer membrane protein assembly factor BamB